MSYQLKIRTKCVVFLCLILSSFGRNNVKIVEETYLYSQRDPLKWHFLLIKWRHRWDGSPYPWIVILLLLLKSLPLCLYCISAYTVKICLTFTAGVNYLCVKDFLLSTLFVYSLKWEFVAYFVVCLIFVNIFLNIIDDMKYPFLCMAACRGVVYKK